MRARWSALSRDAAPAFLCFTLAVGAFRSGAAEGGAQIQLTSPAFREGEPIPPQYTCQGSDASPRLTWSGVPEAAKFIVLIMDDPDAPSGTWTHWVLYDLPSSITELPEGLPRTRTIPQGGKQGLNSFKRLGYGGPCPPSGKAHRYFFRIYAVDAPLGLQPGATRNQIERALEGRQILANGHLMGAYRRAKAE